MKCICSVKQAIRGCSRVASQIQASPLMARPISGQSLLPIITRKCHSQVAVENPETQRDAHTFHQQIQILDNKKQSCYLTKSVLKNELPASFQKPLDLEVEKSEDIMKRFEQNIIDTRLFCSGDNRHKRRENSAVDMFLNMLQITFGNTSHRYPSNLSKSVNYKQHFSAAISRLNEFEVHITGKPEKSFLMMSKDALSQFAPDDEVSQTAKQEIVWDEIFKPIFHMPERKTSFKTDTPYFSGAPFPFPHTLFIVPHQKTEMERLIGQGLLYSFANTYGYALKNSANTLGKDLIKPISVQCVISDGQYLTFICYQLNTLDFTSDDGIKNIVWMEENVPMFEEAYLKIPGDKRYKGITETEIYVDGFNKEAFEKFMKFVLND